MIETIIKRNGTEEPLIPHKINGWGEWGVLNLDVYVDWSSIVLETVGSLPTVVSSQVLQEQLIKTTLDQDGWSPQLFAGRLFAVYLQKKIFGDKIPTVKEQHERLHRLGFMVKLNYSDEEYAQVEEWIDHQRDMNCPHFALKQVREKYSLQNRVTREEYETQQFVYMRMAMALAEDQPAERRMQDVYAWYEHFSHKRINAPTPNYVNLGTKLRGYASCCVFTTEDDARSLAIGDHIAYIMTCMSAGIGSFIKTRSIGDAVRGGLIKHKGKYGYYDVQDAAVHANLQNGRGGALTTHNNAFDPEIELLTRLKNPRSTEDKQIRGLDYSFSANRLFDRKALKNEPIFTFNCFTAPDLFDAFYGKDIELFESLYAKYEADESFPKNWVSAREILLVALNEAFETGRHYETNIEEMNRHTPFKDPIYSSNLCVAPETLLMTKQGYQRIGDLDGQKVTVWNGSEWSRTAVVKTGTNQKLLKVITDSGHELNCTPYHKFYLFNGYGKPYREVRAHELRSGDKLAKFELPVIHGRKKLKQAYVNGFYSGDGCLTREGQRIYLYGEEKIALAERFEGGSDWTVQEKHNRIYKHYHDLQDKFFVPQADYTVQTRLEWLAGWLDADGCVYRNGTNQQLVGVSNEFDFLSRVQLMLQTLGVNAKIVKACDAGPQLMPLNDGSGDMGEFNCKAAWRLLINSNDAQTLVRMGIDFGRLELAEHEPQRSAARFISVEDIIDEGRIDDTYCVNEPKNHTVMFNGILTGQCQEIALPTKGYVDMRDLYSEEDHGRGEVGMCSLGGIVISNIENDAQYQDAMYYTLLMIDKCIHLSDYALPHIGVTAKARMSAGVGIMGYAHYLARKGIKYSTQEGKEEHHRVAEKHMYFAIEASLRLGKELGNAPWMHKTLWPEGWMPIDTYNRAVDQIVAPVYQFDWEDLRARVVANGGIRNSVLVAYMPGESSSKASGTTNSIYPIRDLNLLKSDNGVVMQWSAPEGEKLADAYEFAWDIETIHQIHMYALFQKFTDQGISADMFRRLVDDEKVSSQEMLRDRFNRTKFGLKSKYYQNVLTTDGTDLTIGTENAAGAAGCAGGACTL